jgi:hypothetical protein
MNPPFHKIRRLECSPSKGKGSVAPEAQLKTKFSRNRRFPDLAPPFPKVELDIIKVNLLVYICLTLPLNQCNRLILLLVSKYNITTTVVVFGKIPVFLL